MKVLKVVFIGICVLLILVFIGGFIFLKNFDVEKYKPQIISQASAILARPFDVKDIKLQVSLKEGIRLNLKDLTIGDDPDFQQGDFFKVSDVFLGVDVMALLKGTVAVSKVHVQAPQIVIIKTADGRINAQTIWKKPDAGESAVTGQPADSAASTEPQGSANNKPVILPAVFVDSINIDNAVIQYIDRSFQPELNVTMDQLSLKVLKFSLDRPFSFEVSGRAFSAEKNYKVAGKAQLNVAKNEVKGNNISISSDLGKLALDKIRALPMLKGVPFPDVLQGQVQVNVKNFAAGPQGLVALTTDVSFTDGAVTVKEAAPGIAVALSQIGVNLSNFSLNKNESFDFKVQAASFSKQPNILLQGWGNFDMATQSVALKNTTFTTDLGVLSLPELRSSMAMLKDVPFPDLLAGKLNVTVKDLSAGPQGLGDIAADVQFTDGAVQMKVAEGMSFNASALGLNITGFSLADPFKFSFQAAYLSNVPNIKVDGQAQLDMEQQLVSLQNTKMSTNLESFDTKLLRIMSALKDAPLPESMRGQFNVMISEMTAGATGLVSLVSQGELLQGSAKLKELAVSVEPIRLKFTSTKTQITLEDFFIGLGKASIKAGVQVDDYAGKQMFSADLDLRGFDLKEILNQEKAEVKIEGLMSGQMTVQGQGFKPENMDRMTGEGSLEIKEGKLVDLNVLKMALSQIPILSNFSDALVNLLPEPYRTRLEKKDTVFGQAEMKIAIKDGDILMDPIQVDAEEFQFLGKTNAKFDLTYSTEGAVYISSDMSEKMVAAVEELEFLMSPEERKIVLPLKVSGKGGSNPTFIPDPGYISKKLIQQKGASEIKKALNKVFGQEEEAAPSGGNENPQQNPPQEEKAPEQEIIENIFDSIFK